MNCPHCGKEIPTQQSKAATSRWSKLTPEQKSYEMSKRRRKGIIAKAREAAIRSNTEKIERKIAMEYPGISAPHIGSKSAK